MSALPVRADHHVSTPFEQIRTEYDYIVIGGGGTAAAFVDAVLEHRCDARILILEQGPFLLPTHVQNLGLAFQPLMASAAATPWTSDGDLEIVAQVPYLGGRTLMWSGSCPRPTAHQLRRWPRDIVDGLDGHWDAAASWVGARPASTLGAEFGFLHGVLREAAATVATRELLLVTPKTPEELDAPLAHRAGTDGGAQKFSAIVPLLRATIRNAGVDLVTECGVQSLITTGEAITAIQTVRGEVPVSGARVVLACGSTEATSIVLRSREQVDAPLAGANLAANAATFFMCRLPRSAFVGLSVSQPELAALYIDGATEQREFHLHVSAVASADPTRDVDRVYQLMPDMFGGGTPTRSTDPDHVVLVIHGLSEVAGHGADPAASSLRIEADGEIVGRFRLDDADHAAWRAMDDAADALLETIAAGTPVQYWNPSSGQWQPEPPERRMPFAFHEASTLWMGDEGAVSVTDSRGRVRSTSNLYILGGAAFPTRGSWNPFLTMVALARRLAEWFEHGHGMGATDSRHDAPGVG